MIENIYLNSESAVGSTLLEVNSQNGVTIFVGPNNSGKSALLEGIYSKLAGSKGDTLKNSAINKICLTPFNEQILEKDSRFRGKSLGEMIKTNQGHRDKKSWIRLFSSNWDEDYSRAFRKTFSIWMNGSRRLSMLPDEKNANLTNAVQPLANFLTDDSKRANFQADVFKGIGHFPVIDTLTTYGQLKLSFSVVPPNPSMERGLTDEFIKFIEEAIPASSASDGFNAYVGMLGALYASDYEVILIDEPEAFLHPALARTLGRQIAQRSQGRHVFVATHSADFLMGTIEAGIDVRIVRLQYSGGHGTACLLDESDLVGFMNDPLLRSANVLSGLFAKSVVVTESDTDRAFYQEINTRLLTDSDPRGIENCVFLNAQNKQTVPRIVRLLRKMGVPAVGIVDLDIVSDGGVNWTNQMAAFGVPNAMQSSLNAGRVSTRDSLRNVSTDAHKKSYKTEGGLNLLAQGECEAATTFLRTLQDYGMLVVPTGEVESWLPETGVSRSKHSWLHEIFEKMGADSTDADYIRPSTGDVWDFIGNCNEWLSNPERRGMNQD